MIKKACATPAQTLRETDVGRHHPCLRTQTLRLFGQLKCIFIVFHTLTHSYCGSDAIYINMNYYIPKLNSSSAKAQATQISDMLFTT